MRTAPEHRGQMKSVRENLREGFRYVAPTRYILFLLAILSLVLVPNTVIQTLVDERMRGRVMSFYAMAFMGAAPFGSLLAGAAAHHIGAPTPWLPAG